MTTLHEEAAAEAEGVVPMSCRTPIPSGLHTTPLSYPPLSSVTDADTYKLLSTAEPLVVQDGTKDNLDLSKEESATATANNEGTGLARRPVVRFHDQVTAISPVASVADFNANGVGWVDGLGAGASHKKRKLRQERISTIAMNSS